MHVYLVWFGQFQLFQKITDTLTLVTLWLYHLSIFWVFNNCSIAVKFLRRRKKGKILNTWSSLFQGQLPLSTALSCYSLLAFRIWLFQNTSMEQGMFLFRTKLGILIMTLPVTHEGLNKQATYALILLTSIKIMELKFLKHGCLTIKKHDSQSVKRQSYKGMISKTQNNNEDQNAPMTAHHNPPITSNYCVTNSDT